MGSVLCDASHGSAGDSAYGNKVVILQVAEPVHSRDPNSPAIVLKESVRVQFIQLSGAFALAGQELYAPPSVVRNLPVHPSAQAAAGCEPDTSVFGSQNRRDLSIQ